MFQCAQGQQINCAPKFLDQYMYKFSFEKPKKKSLQNVNIINVELRYFIFQSVIKNVLQKICFLQILRPLRLWRPKAMALLA